MLTALLGVLSPVLDKVLSFIPNPVERAKAQAQMEADLRAQETALLMAFINSDAKQVEVNKAEAENPNLFVSGWRPFVGWVCGVGIAWTFVLQPVADWILSIYAPKVVTPVLDSSQLMSLLLGLLGMGAMRSFDKLKGTSK